MSLPGRFARDVPHRSGRYTDATNREVPPLLWGALLPSYPLSQYTHNTYKNVSPSRVLCRRSKHVWQIGRHVEAFRLRGGPPPPGPAERSARSLCCGEGRAQGALRATAVPLAHALARRASCAAATACRTARASRGLDPRASISQITFPAEAKAAHAGGFDMALANFGAPKYGGTLRFDTRGRGSCTAWVGPPSPALLPPGLCPPCQRPARPPRHPRPLPAGAGWCMWTPRMDRITSARLPASTRARTLR